MKCCLPSRICRNTSVRKSTVPLFTTKKKMNNWCGTDMRACPPVSIYTDWLCQARKGRCQPEPTVRPPLTTADVSNSSCAAGSSAADSHVSETPQKGRRDQDLVDCTSRPGNQLSTSQLLVLRL